MKKKNMRISLLTSFLTIGSTTGIMLVTTSCVSKDPSDKELLEKRTSIVESILDKYLDQSSIENYFNFCKDDITLRNSDFADLIIQKEFLKVTDDDPLWIYHGSNGRDVKFCINRNCVSNYFTQNTAITLNDFVEHNIFPLWIERNAFQDCVNLQYIEIPDTLMFIDNYALSIYNEQNPSKGKPLQIRTPLSEKLRFIGVQNEVTWVLDKPFDLSTLKEVRYLGNNVFNKTKFNNSYKFLPPKLRYLGSAFNNLSFDDKDEQNDKNKDFDRIVFPDTLEVINGKNIYFGINNYYGRKKNESLMITLPKNLKYFCPDAFNPDCSPIIDFSNIMKNNVKTIFPKHNVVSVDGWDNFLFFPSISDLDKQYTASRYDSTHIKSPNNFPKIIDQGKAISYVLIFPKTWKERIQENKEYQVSIDSKFTVLYI